LFSRLGRYIEAACLESIMQAGREADVINLATRKKRI
jgi:hypothetical protein